MIFVNETLSYTTLKERNLFEQFIYNRRYLKNANVTLTYVNDDNSPYLFISNPIIISAFAGYVKNRYPGKNIYFRGEAGNHPYVVPSLFRDGASVLTDGGDIQNRYKAYKELKRITIAYFKKKVSRFRDEDVDIHFQHYGIKSPVIDMVDNIYVATWFAMDGNKDKFGYIRLMDTSNDDLSVFDLRKLNSSLSLRLHTQHGLIAKKKITRWTKNNIYFDSYEIARIKFPVKRNILGGTLFSHQNIYPGIELDNTYKILKQSSWFADAIVDTEKKYGLAPGILGRVN